MNSCQWKGDQSTAQDNPLIRPTLMGPRVFLMLCGITPNTELNSGSMTQQAKAMFAEQSRRLKALRVMGFKEMMLAE